MEAILIKRKKLNLNDDYGIQKSWDEINEVLSENEENTISYLKIVIKKIYIGSVKYLKI